MKSLVIQSKNPICIDEQMNEVYQVCGGNMGLMKTLAQKLDAYGDIQTGYAHAPQES